MDDVTRRNALGLLAGLTAVAAAHADDKPPRKTDRDCVLEVGMTPAEADCWELAANLAGKFFDLPADHPSDAQEVATAIHTIQNKLLARPTYRKYLELAKKAHGK